MFNMYSNVAFKYKVRLKTSTKLPICKKNNRAASTAANVNDARYHTDSYQYLQHSKLPTMFFQRSLPRLPIPHLNKTCDRFLAAVEPILEAEVFRDTKALVDNFCKGAGMDLHARLRLQDTANKHTSYISQPWFDMYLSDRKPLPLNYNPLLVMKGEQRAEYSGQIERAANLVISSLRFLRSLRAEILEPEVYHLNKAKSDTESYRRWMSVTPSFIATYASYAFKAFPLDMSQFSRLFGTTRIPRLNKDELTQCIDSKHILVLRCGHMYAVNVLNENGHIEQPNVILGRLQTVMQMAEQRERNTVPLGILTTAERNFWAETRDHIVKNTTNANLLENQVDAALFCLCLDDPTDPIYSEQNPVPLFKNFLAGEGHNRWFDKSFSLLVSADGTAAVNFEHSWGDGVAVLRYFNEIYKDSLQIPFVNTSTIPSQTTGDENNVRAINFELDESTCAAMASASAKNMDIIQSLNMHTLKYPHISKTACKLYGLSPDSIMQLSFQLAYKQAFNKYVGTYESCSTAIFRHGRTETMRPCTMATKNFCESALSAANNRPDVNDLRAMIDYCSKKHSQLTKDAAMGQGFDRHLFALKNIAINNQLPVPEFYDSEAYHRINYNIISTSTLSSDALLAGAFGPVVKDGLGIGYSIQNDFCGTIVTSYENQGNGKLFIENLEDALNHIRQIIEQCAKKK